MPLVFTLPELVAMGSAVLLMIVISNDGDTNWFEGATLLAAYIIMGIGFFFFKKMWIKASVTENTKEKGTERVIV